MLTINTIISCKDFTLITPVPNPDREISKPFCCDLLSIAMGKACENACWVTVMANVNTLAVATLTDVSCIILAEGAQFDEATLQKAITEEIVVFTTPLPVFDAALKVHESAD
ncbi:MAG: hypothetical protein E7288_02530 [Lachnospiraceae bacterium]|nr:hypothetical protein [Lachnospiraceae bacterium]